MAKKKNKIYSSVEYTDGLISALLTEEINPEDKRVKILETFEDLEEAKKHAEKHAEKHNLTYKF